MSLSACYKKADADKKDHQYWRVYESAFEKHFNDDFKLLEIGVFHGASFRAHLQYFDKAGKLYGLDTFERRPLSHSSFDDLKNNDRVNLKEGNSVLENKDLWHDQKFDIIIDDGSHLFNDQRKTLKNNWWRLKSGGVYFIEDVFPIHTLSDTEVKDAWRKYNTYNSIDFSRKQHALLMGEIAQKQNYIEHDLRSYSKKVNSFIIEIRK